MVAGESLHSVGRRLYEEVKPMMRLLRLKVEMGPLSLGGLVICMVLGGTLLLEELW